MNNSRFLRTFIIGICVTVLSSGMVLAGEGGGQSPSYSGQTPMDKAEDVERQPDILIDRNDNSPDAAVSSQDSEPTLRSEPSRFDEEILQKHREIDQYLFEENPEEVKQKGFIVTHTGPIDNYVEIGITPFSEENADYLYDIFGTDMVRVVEGQQAELLSQTVAPANGIEVDDARTISIEDEQAAKTSSSTLVLIYSIAAFIILGGSLIAIRKFKKSKKS